MKNKTVIFSFLLLLINNSLFSKNIDSNQTKLIVKELKSIRREFYKFNKDSSLYQIGNSINVTNERLSSINNNIDSLILLSKKGTPWDGFWPNFWSEIAGAFLGALVTIILFYFTFIKDKEKAISIYEKESKQNISYMRNLLESIIPKLKKQAAEIKSHFESILLSPYNFPEFKLLALNDLNRLSIIFANDKYFHSFLGNKDDSKESIDLYREIGYNVDFLFEIVNQITKEQVINAQKFNHERFTKYSNLIKELFEYIYRTGIDTKEENSEFSVLLLSTFESAQNVWLTENLQFIQEKIIVPLKSQLHNFSSLNQTIEIVLLLNNITQLYNIIKLSNEDHANRLKTDYEKIIDSISTLETDVKKF